MSHWNHRVVRTVHASGEVLLALHDVYQRALRLSAPAFARLMQRLQATVAA